MDQNTSAQAGALIGAKVILSGKLVNYSKNSIPLKYEKKKAWLERRVKNKNQDTRILFKHILPNIMAPVIVISAANFASAILIEAGLSFLGIGTQPPIPSWGSMIKEHYAYIIMDKAYLAVVPGIAIMLLVFAFVVLGNALRDALDVKT